MYVHSVVLRKCVEPEALLKERCRLLYLEKCKLCLQELENPICSCYAAEILANHKLEKEKKI